MKIKKLITVQDGDNLTRYFQEIKNYQPLTREQERELIIKIQSNNDPKALDTLVKSNLKFVISVAKHYQGQGVNLLDLISEGNTGLVRAAKKFDTTTTHKFFSYAVWWIRIHIFTSLDLHKRTVQLPANREMLVTRVKKEILELEQSLGRYPSLEELQVFIARKFKKEKKENPPSIDDLIEAISFGGKAKSINEKIGEEEGDTLEQLLPANDNLGIDENQSSDSLQTDLNRFLFNLTQYEYDVLILSSGLNEEEALRNPEISKALKINEKEILKLKLKAVKRLKRLKGINTLMDYLK